MNEQEINSKFTEITQPNVNPAIKQPAKFPELRYLWGITGIVCVFLLILGSVISIIIESL
jgi:hypothetical protein